MEINVGGTWKQCYTVGCNSCVSSSCSGGCVGSCSGQCMTGLTTTGAGPSLGDSTTKQIAIKPSINVGGTFKQVSIVKINISGTWKNESTF